MANPRKYYRPKTLEEAIRIVQETNGLSLAGGALTFGDPDMPYETLIDLQDVPEMCRFEPTEEGITLGAAVMLEHVLHWGKLPPALRDALQRVIPLNIRNYASLGETLKSRRNRMLREWLAGLVAHNVTVERYTIEAREQRWEEIEHLLISGNIDEGIITGLAIPTLRPNERLETSYVACTPADSSMVNAAVGLVLEEDGTVAAVRVALCGVSEAPVTTVQLDNLVGRPLDEPNILSAVKLIAPQIAPKSERGISVRYSREMARVCVERALRACAEKV